MGTTYQSAPGRWHVQIKLHGDPDRIRLFHAILKDIETDWAFHKPYSHRYYSDTLSVCRVCRGITISNTRITPQDIKSAAAQVGIGCKIYNFAKEDHCGSCQARGSAEMVDRKYAEVLYSHKPGRIHLDCNAAWVGNTPPQEVQDALERKARMVGPPTNLTMVH